MRIIQKSILQLKEAEYFIYHLSIINPFLPVELTPKEKQVLGTFMSFSGDIAEKNRFGTTCRKIVKEKLNMSDGGLSNHLAKLKEKEAIIEVNNMLVISSFLVPSKKQQNYQFKIRQEDEVATP
jgi:hypothetical protein